jgi:hypothetical protein
MTSPIKKEQKSVNANQRPLIIYRDDHRNNHDFLSKHPHTQVLDHDAPKKHKKPHHHHSVHKHHPKTKTKPSHSSVHSLAPKMTAQNGNSLNNNDHDDDNELEESQTDQANESDDSDNSHEQKNSFLFHEMAEEGYDPEADLFEQADSERLAVREGAMQEIGSNKLPIDNITIDPKSFVLQTDAQDGSVTFKASVLFDLDGEYEDYDVIVTHIAN